jgi:hypothetical protein
MPTGSVIEDAMNEKRPILHQAFHATNSLPASPVKQAKAKDLRFQWTSDCMYAR